MTPPLELPEEAALVLDFNKADTIHDRIEVKRRALKLGYHKLADAMLNYLLPSKGALDVGREMFERFVPPSDLQANQQQEV